MALLTAGTRSAFAGTRTSLRVFVVRARYYSDLADAVPKKTKLWDNADEAVAGDAIKSGDTLLCAGKFIAHNLMTLELMRIHDDRVRIIWNSRSDVND